MSASGKAQSGESAYQAEGFSAGNRFEDSAVFRKLEIRHREEILDLFLGIERKKWLAEAFQLKRVQG
ncbi:hypothetical protein [Pseudomonas sp. PDM27]|uniref:hypothetical protein n=1 Tax=Pseudomonas sp. PDM27 TaxID=2854769 RepID=UPI003526D65B